MKRLLFLLIIAASSIAIYAEKLEDRYVSRLVSDGLLFFIEPFELPNQQKGQAAELDITYLIQKDSLTLNMSIYAPTMIQTDSIQFVGNTSMTLTRFETFFIDKDGKKYVHRYSCKLPYAYWEELYANEKPFQMNIYAGTQQLRYGYSDNNWQKERTWMRQIMLIIKRNQQAGQMPTYLK